MTISWEVGKYYLTEGSLIARIDLIKEKPLPKNLTEGEYSQILSREYYGISGFVFSPSNLSKGYRAEWTLKGIHLLDHRSSRVGNLTTEEYHESNK